MMNLLRTSLAAGLCLVAAASARAALIANWQFDSYAGGNLVNFRPDAGDQAGGATANSTAPTGGSLLKIAGTTVNQSTASSPNNALEFRNNTGNPTANVLTLRVSGTELSGFVVTYAAQTDHSSLSISWAWSTDGIRFTPLGAAAPTFTSAWATYTVDFSGVTTIDGAADVYFRGTFDSNGNNTARFVG